MGLLDNNIIVNVFSTSPPVTSAGFGTPLFLAAPGTLGVGFTDRVRFYTRPSEVATDLLSGDLSAVAANALNAALGQTVRASRIGCGRIDTLVARISTLTITYGADGDIFTATVNGIATPYTAVALDDADAVALALAGLMVTSLAAEPVTVTFALNVITITSTDADDPFTLSSAVTGTGTIVEADSTPAVSPASELDLLIASEADWYGLTEDPAGYTDVAMETIAAWAQTNKRLHLPQSSTTDIKDGTAGNLGLVLAALSYDYSGVVYHHDDTEYAALSWLSYALATDLDTTTTAWAYKVLTGVTISPLTTTERTTLEASNINFIQDFYGATSTWAGTVANGDYIDVRTTKDWVAARIAERIAQVFLDASARNSKVPYDDQGIQSLAGVVDAVLLDGIVAGHFVQDTNDVTAPDAADVSDADKAARLLTLEFAAQLAGAIAKVTVTGYVTIAP